MWTTAFWTGTLDRAVKSFAQALILLWGADAGFSVLSVDWRSALGVGAGAAVLSMLTSLVSNRVGSPGTTSLLPGGS